MTPILVFMIDIHNVIPLLLFCIANCRGFACMLDGYEYELDMSYGMALSASV
jgi:hypothetical protein